MPPDNESLSARGSRSNAGKYLAIATAWLARVGARGEREPAVQALSHLRGALDEVRDCVYQFSPDTLRFSYVNRGTAELLGYDVPELLRMHPYDISPQYSETEFRRLMAPLLEGADHLLQIETLHRRKDGHEVPVEVLLQRMAPAGSPVRILGIVTDITRRNTLDLESARLAAIVRSANDAMASADMQGRFVSWNAAAEKMFGYTADEVIGRTPGELLVPVDRMGEHAQVTERLFRGDVVPAFDTVRLTKTGRRIDVSAGPAVIKDARGRLLGVSAFWRDITERRRAEAMLAESEAKYRLLAENAQDYIVLLDAEGRVLYDSPSIVRLMGERYTMQRTVGKESSLAHPDDRQRLGREFRCVVETGKAALLQYRWRLPSGEVRWQEQRFTPIAGADGRIERVLAVSRDVSKRKQAEEAQRVLVSELHHRTRNILAIVQSIARDTLRAAATPEAFAQRFDERLDALSRVQSLLSRPADAPITIGELLAQEMEALGGGMVDGKMALAGPEVTVPRNAVQMLALAVHELATNARKHGALAGERGRLSVTWRLEVAQPDRQLVLEWTESDVVVDPGAKDRPDIGYGRMLIEKALPYTLAAETRFELGGSGLRCMIRLPLAAGSEARP